MIVVSTQMATDGDDRSDLRAARRGQENYTHLLADSDHIPAFAQSPADGVHGPDEAEQRRTRQESANEPAAESSSRAQAGSEDVVQDKAECRAGKDLDQTQHVRLVSRTGVSATRKPETMTTYRRGSRLANVQSNPTCIESGSERPEVRRRS